MYIVKISSLKNACLHITSKTPLKIEAILFYNHHKFFVTWFSDDCMIYDDFSDDEGLQEIFCNEISNYFRKEVNKMKKQELFEKAVNAMDNYTKAVEMGLSDFANYYDCKTKELYGEINAKGLCREFEEFALII